MSPVPGVVGAVVSVEHIVACILQELCGLFAFLHVSADFLIVFSRQGTIAEILYLGDNAVPQGHRVVVAADLLDVLHNLRSEAVAVFKAAAVSILPVVGVLHGKLVQKIPLVDSVDFHAVDACFLAQSGGLAEGLDDFLNLLQGHLRAGNTLSPTGGEDRGAGHLVVGVQNGLCQYPQHGIFVQVYHLVGNTPGAAHTGGNLHEQLGAGGVDLLHVRLQLPEHLLVLVQPAAADGVPDGGNAGDNQSHIVLCPLQEEVGRFLVKVVGLHPAEQRGAAHGAQDDAVLDFHIPDFPGGKQRLIF